MESKPDDKAKAKDFASKAKAKAKDDLQNQDGSMELNYFNTKWDFKTVMATVTGLC